MIMFLARYLKRAFNSFPTLTENTSKAWNILKFTLNNLKDFQHYCIQRGYKINLKLELHWVGIVKTEKHKYVCVYYVGLHRILNWPDIRLNSKYRIFILKKYQQSLFTFLIAISPFFYIFCCNFNCLLLI